jgi:hypothetical protein
MSGTRTVRYLGVAGVAAWFGVAPATVTKWLARYDGWPEPDAMIGTEKGWLPEREQEWRAWKAALPGQGAPGQPKPRHKSRAAANPPQGGDAR